MTRTAIIAATALLLLLSCGGTPRRAAPSEGEPPRWIKDGGRSLYDPGRYLVGTGDGLTAEQAKDAAAGSRARTVESHVESEEQTTEDYAQHGEEDTWSVLSRRRTRVEASQTLEGGEVARVEESGGRFFALAILDKIAWLKKKRAAFDEELALFERDSATALDGAARARERLRAAVRALTSFDEMRHLVARAAVLAPGGLKLPEDSAEQAGRVRVELDALRARHLATRLELTGPAAFAGEVAEALGAVLSEHGVPITPDKAEARYELRARLSVEADPSDDGWFRFRYSLSAHLEERGKGVALVSLNAAGKAAHTSDARARAKLVRAVASRFEQEAAGRITAALYGLGTLKESDE